MSDLTPIGRDVTAQLVKAMVLAGVAEAYGLLPHDDYEDDPEEGDDGHR